MYEQPSSDQSQQQANNIYEKTAQGSRWAAHEATRLENMGAMLAPIARQDLGPLLGEMVAAHQGKTDQLIFVDIGCGTDGTSQELSLSYGVGYLGIDRRADFLAQRSVHPRASTAVGNAADLLDIIPRGSADISFARAVKAWGGRDEQGNLVADRMIAEQLDITAPGGYMVCTEFDWTEAGAVDIREMASIMRLKTIMLGTLQAGGFDPSYGRNYGEAIRRVAQEKGIRVEIQEHTHELEPGDYRRILMETVDNIAQQLREQIERLPENEREHSHMALMLAQLLRSAAEVNAVPRTIRMPSIVTQVVHVLPH